MDEDFDSFIKSWELYSLGTNVAYDSQQGFGKFVLSLEGPAKHFYEEIVAEDVNQIKNDAKTEYSITKLVDLLKKRFSNVLTPGDYLSNLLSVKQLPHESISKFMSRFSEKMAHVVFGGNEAAQNQQKISIFIESCNPEISYELNKMRDTITTLQDAMKISLRLENIMAKRVPATHVAEASEFHINFSKNSPNSKQLKPSEKGLDAEKQPKPPLTLINNDNPYGGSHQEQSYNSFPAPQHSSFPTNNNQYGLNLNQNHRPFYNQPGNRYNQPQFYNEYNTTRPYMDPKNYLHPGFQPRPFRYRTRPPYYNQYQPTSGFQNPRLQRMPFRGTTRPVTKLPNPSFGNRFSGQFYNPRGGLSRTPRPVNNSYWSHFSIDDEIYDESFFSEMEQYGIYCDPSYTPFCQEESIDIQQDALPIENIEKLAIMDKQDDTSENDSKNE